MSPMPPKVLGKEVLKVPLGYRMILDLKGAQTLEGGRS
jgi:hypothetical protein